MVPDEGVTGESIEQALKNLDTGDAGWGIVLVGGEEHLPNRKFADVVRKVAKEHPKREYIFGTFEDVLRELAPRMKALEGEEKIKTSVEVEGNPTSSGCLVTRIRTKLETRAAEAVLLSAEHLATRTATLLGDAYPRQILDTAWRDLCFTQFHDAVTATHINAAYDELMDMFAGIKAGAASVRLDAARSIAGGLKTDARKGIPLVVFNTASVPQTDVVEMTAVLDSPLGENETVRVVDAAGETMAVEEAVQTWRDDGREVRVSFVAKDVPAVSQSVFYIKGGGRTRARSPKSLDIQNEFLRVNVREKAIAGIVHRETGKSVFPSPEFPANTLFLEDDGGDPWGTLRPVGFRENLADHNLRAYREDIGRTQRIVIEGRYQGQDKDTMGLAWTQEILLRPGVPRVDFGTTVDWDTRSRRLRVGFPVGANSDRARYGVPYGNVVRDAYDPRYWHHNMPNGDWPATYWVDIKRPFGGLALLNRGLLSHRMQDGSLYLSLLRSPEDRFCLNEPEFYDCPDYDGALDRGRHRFEYALYPHAGDYRAADVAGRAWAYNHPLVALREARHDGEESPAPWIRLDGSGVLLGAVKKAEKGEEIVLRLYETHGRKSTVRIGTSFRVSRVEEANMLERKRTEIDLGRPVVFRPHEIKTLVLHPVG
jgi:alpha-mannosidase